MHNLKLILITCLIASPLALFAKESKSVRQNSVEIRRTTDGIPHILAKDWRGLGYGYGYAQAQDALCTLAEAFVTFEGKRSYFFGSENRPEQNSTFGRVVNLDLDFFFRAFIDDSIIKKYRDQQPRELNNLIEGFASGYNRYVQQVKQDNSAGRSCVHRDWVRQISADDIYRRIYAAGLAAGYARFIPAIVNAKPLTEKASANENLDALRSKLSYSIGDQRGLGSNMIAFGKTATHENKGVLFGNPHWYWGGPDRFYQAHLTIPGKVNVAGASFLGMPIITIGFNENIAWSHTVSQARRFGLFELKLSPSSPITYQYDNTAESMQTKSVSVDTVDQQGNIRKVTRTLYSTRFGPVIDLGQQSEAFSWDRNKALAIQDINADNFRTARLYFKWAQAKSLDEFIDIQRHELALPWVNTTAIGRKTGKVWYGDVGAIPNVPDTLRGKCTAQLSNAFASVDPLTPLLDGSKSSCNWSNDIATERRTGQQGLMPAADLPSLFHEDYVANMNDSHWLTNAKRPLEGFALILGGEKEALSLRSQYGHHLAVRLENSAQSISQLAEAIKRESLNPKAFSAELYKSSLLKFICTNSKVTVVKDVLTEKAYQPSREVNVEEACSVLSQWSNRGNSDDRGSLLWDAFWNRLEKIPNAISYPKHFAADKPLRISIEINTFDKGISEALGAAVLALEKSGVELNTPRGNLLYVQSGQEKIPLFGGCADVGYFTIACPDKDNYRMDKKAHANTYMQVVYFDKDGVKADTLLAHGLDEDAITTGPNNQDVNRYGQKNWLRFPFNEKQILHDPAMKRMVLHY